MHALKNLGFSLWFQKHCDAVMAADNEVARVFSVHKDSYIISKGSGDVYAELSGNLIYTANFASELPTVGDWVYANFYDDDMHAIIHNIFPRKTLLKRKTPGKLVDIQMIAANIDVAFIVQSVDYNFNLRRLERYLVMVNESGITPVILLSKCDLLSISAVEEIKKSISDIAPQEAVLTFSNLNGDNINTIQKSLLPGKSYCLIGSSGVGKTTLLNSLLGSTHFETQPVSRKNNKGKHTTTSRELIQLESGAILIDTPGMRELGNMLVDTGIDETFAEILALSKKCKFNNCSHSNEKGCAIVAAIASGELSRPRYQNYLKMMNESAFNEMSYSEKRKKDKDFGKMIKSTMQSKKRW